MRKSSSVAIVLLSVLIAMSLPLIAGCGSGTGSSAGQSTSPNSSAGMGVPAYPGTNPQESFAGVFKMVTTDSFAQVVEFYKKQFPQATFSQIAIDTGQGASFLIDDAIFHGNISVEENFPAKGQVTITVSRFVTK